MEISLFCHWCDRYHFIFDNIRLATQLKKTAVSFYIYNIVIYIYNIVIYICVFVSMCEVRHTVKRVCILIEAFTKNSTSSLA